MVGYLNGEVYIYNNPKEYQRTGFFKAENDVEAFNNNKKKVCAAENFPSEKALFSFS